MVEALPCLLGGQGSLLMLRAGEDKPTFEVWLCHSNDQLRLHTVQKLMM